ncbi:MAG: 30S ribosomal protein S12 methylthiotransferase RimO [Firmicutes bacterium]|nr:30S ribosomal protein S12 methylthiotransferase RimO [Bacillota bacterium]
MKVFIKTLGCEKNTVDSEFAAGLLAKAGHVMTDDPLEADVMLVNTCGFIGDAKAQSIETIIDLGKIKKKGQRLYVSGCLSQRYASELKDLMPEVDGFLGVNDYDKLPSIIGEKGFKPLVSKEGKQFDELGERLDSLRETPWTAPIKIAEGCNNICTYCAIPFIRGKYRSRRPENIISEAEKLAASGVKELVVIAQDVTAYGCDMGRDDMLPELLRSLCAIDGIEWIRLMYCYEDEITDELIKTIRDEEKICKYIDIPIQHSNDRVLRAMNRKSTDNSIKSTIKRLRESIPGITIRTTLIAGFPTETKAEHFELRRFVRDMAFDRLGVFAYSREEGTAAARMKPQIPKSVKERRRDRIMEIQRSISLEHNRALIGRTLKVLVEEIDEDGTYIGRSEMDAPEIDNSVIFSSEKPLKPGDFTEVLIEDAFDYDITGKAVN